MGNSLPIYRPGGDPPILSLTGASQAPSCAPFSTLCSEIPQRRLNGHPHKYSGRSERALATAIDFRPNSRIWISASSLADSWMYPCPGDSFSLIKPFRLANLCERELASAITGSGYETQYCTSQNYVNPTKGLLDAWLAISYFGVMSSSLSSIKGEIEGNQHS